MEEGMYLDNSQGIITTTPTNSCNAKTTNATSTMPNTITPTTSSYYISRKSQHTYKNFKILIREKHKDTEVKSQETDKK